MSITPGKKANYIFYLFIFVLISSFLTNIVLRQINNLENFNENLVYYE